MEAIDMKTLTPEQQSIVEYSREYLSELAAGSENLAENFSLGHFPKGESSPPSYNWFGCENDAELLAEIEQIAKGENLCAVNESELVRILDIMYHG